MLVLVAVFSFTVKAQETFGPTSFGMIEGPIYVPSLAQQMENGTFIPANDKGTLGHPKMRRGNIVVPGKGFPKGGDPLVDNQKNAQLQRVQPPLLTFLSTTSTGTPGDPTGAAGPNHYIAAWNTSFRIFDKSGNPLTNAASLATLFPGNAIGDPIVFYDAQADRFVITEFDNSPNGFNVAVCQGSDPVNDGWYIYTTGFGTGAFPDYTKFAAFGDVYMVTANISSTNRVFAVERNEMLNGNPAQFVGLPLPGIATSGFYSPHAFHTTDDVWAPAGTPVPIVYLQDDAWAGVSDDHLKIWSASIDWTNTANSTIGAAQEIITADFTSVFDGGSFSNLPQPGGGPDQDALQATMMNQVQYRRFPTYNSAVMNFVVDTEAGTGELAGIRWYELRQTADGQPWTIYQEGTYLSPNNGKHAFSGSMAMNGNGDIAMGYTTLSNTERIAIYYTGRFAGDPLGQMTVAEELIAQSTANNPSLRLADYVHLTVDPADDNTFWHVAEFFDPGRRHVVAHLGLTPPQPNDIGVTSIDAPVNGILTANEDIVITIKNFGSNDITNPEVQYTIDAGTPVVENYSGTITAGASVSFTFATQADLSVPATYTIEARTNLAGDSNPGNDTATKNVTNGAVYCTPTATSGCNIDGIKKFILNTIDADDGGNGCNTEPAGSPQGYADRTAMSTDLSQGTDYTLQAQMNWSSGVNIEALSVWIDFNDDGIFEVSERLISGELFTVANALQDFTLSIPVDAAVGAHRLRAKAMDTSASGDILDPCSDYDYGETQDYTVNIQTLGIEDVSITNAEFSVVTLPNNQFDIKLTTSFEGTASIAVYNVLGQTVAFNNLIKEGDSYNYHLDMSYANPGVYFIKMGDQISNTYKSAKIIVK